MNQTHDAGTEKMLYELSKLVDAVSAVNYAHNGHCSCTPCQDAFRAAWNQLLGAEALVLAMHGQIGGQQIIIAAHDLSIARARGTDELHQYDMTLANA